MSVSIPETSNSLPREILNALFKDYAVVLRAIIFTNLVFILIALALPTKYQANASLLVLPSVNYSPRTNPGAEPQQNASLNREEILSTEIEILSGPTLHAEIIRKIGLSNLYPELLKPPSSLHQIEAFIKNLKHRIQAALGTAPTPAAPINPVLEALPLFDQDLNLVGLKEGSIIEVSFRNKDPLIAASTINTLIAAYLSERQSLYANIQSQALHDELQATSTQLNALNRQTASFELSHGLADFSEQRRLLLGQQDQLQRDAFSAAGAQAQLESRIAELKKQTYDLVDNDLLRAKADLAAANARLSTDQQELQSVTVKLQQLTIDDAPLDALMRQKTVTEQAYAELAKEYDAARAIEELDQRTAGNVRLIEPAIAPIWPVTHTSIILATGFLLSLLVGFLAALISELRRPGVISPETVSRTLGVSILATIPESSQRRRLSNV